MADLVKLAVARNQSELALVKAALEGAEIRYLASNEHCATTGGHPDLFVVDVADEDVEKARGALEDAELASTLVSEHNAKRPSN